MQHTLSFSETDERRSGSGGLVFSLLLHALIIGLMYFTYEPEAKSEQTPSIQYVDLIPEPQQVAASPNPADVTAGSRIQMHTEAPGPAVERRPPPEAPLSNANRIASSPQPTGPNPTNRPGSGRGTFVPGDDSSPSTAENEPARDTGSGDQSPSDSPFEDGNDRLRFEVREQAGDEADAPAVDWKSAIREIGKVASLGEGAWGTLGGEQGFAQSGPISFETQWYAWGDYADAMVRRIRYHWYRNMPAIVQLGVQGNVVIGFTILRDGTITDIRIIRSSGTPPFDFAARKALELSSPLRSLPDDFPKDQERVTAGFFYNMSPR